MDPLKDTQRQLQQFRHRITLASVVVLLGFIFLAVRLFHLQVWQYRHYALQAEENRISLAPIVPNRGVITDRNGIVLAKNEAVYTLEVIQSKINVPLDHLLNTLNQSIAINAQDRLHFKKLLKNARRFDSVPLRIGLSNTEVARFVTQRFRFPGVEIHMRLFRHYPFGATAAHAIGYISRLSAQDETRIQQASEQNRHNADHYDPRLDAGNYLGTHFIGKTGIEYYYETELHGQTGFEAVEITAGGRRVRTVSHTPAISGKRLMLSLDIGLQQAAEQALAGQRGALVAIEPASGDVLAFVSAPGFDPNHFVAGIDQETWDALLFSKQQPLLNRALRGAYPPGSTYKPFMALAALTLNQRTPEWGFQDSGSYIFAGHTFHDDLRSGHGWVDMHKSIVLSCGTYYYKLAHELGVDTIARFMAPLGFGQLTGIDLPGEGRGVLPSTHWKKQAYQKSEQQKWYTGDTINLGTGQGYNAFTILQLAHATATLANNGAVVKPRLVTKIINPLNDTQQYTVPSASHSLNLRQQDIDVIKRAMAAVTTQGTARQAFRGASYQAAGKTGTAQVFSLRGKRYNVHKISQRQRDHALFIAFAPVDKPQIALALIVENGGWAYKTAAPVARQVLDYYLVDRLKKS
jgi:penicillin-binding protein 2